MSKACALEALEGMLRWLQPRGQEREGQGPGAEPWTAFRAELVGGESTEIT